MKNKEIENLGFFFLFLPVLTLLLCGFSWLVGWHITAFQFPIALILAFILSSKLEYGKLIAIRPLLYGLVLILSFGFISWFFKDGSFDGNWYHQPGIYLMSKGWNPIYQHHSFDLMHDTSNMWIDHYAKGQETVCASIVALTGNIELGKTANFFLPISSLAFVILSLIRLFPSWSEKKVAVLSLIIAFPPIIWNMVATYYIDFILYSIVILTLCNVILYSEKEDSKFVWMFVPILAITISVKFNFIIWFVMLCTGIIIYFIRTKKMRLIRYSLISGIGMIIVALTTFSYNPYISNILDHGSPVYPLAGSSNNVDIMTLNDPVSFKGYNELEKVLVADFSRPTTKSQSTNYFFPYGGYPLKNLTACGSSSVILGGGRINLD